jgi:hypothetical protein
MSVMAVTDLANGAAGQRALESGGTEAASEGAALAALKPPPLEQIQMLSPVDRVAADRRSALKGGLPRRDRYEDRRHRKNHRKPKSETIWCPYHLFPFWHNRSRRGDCGDRIGKGV